MRSSGRRRPRLTRSSRTMRQASVLSPPICMIARSTFLAVLAHPNDNEQRDGSGFAVEPHERHGAVERLAVVGSDYPPTVARLATASAERVTRHCLPMNLGERRPGPMSCTGSRSLSIWLRYLHGVGVARKLKRRAGHEMPRDLRGSVTILQGSTARVWIATRSIRPSTPWRPRPKEARHARRRSLEGIA
jgi:hypothetical protein